MYRWLFCTKMGLSAVVVKDVNTSPFSAKGQCVVFGCSFLAEVCVSAGMYVAAIFKCDCGECERFDAVRLR